MIKRINHQNFLTTPFVAIKSWDLYNIQNVDVIYADSASIDDAEYFIAIDYIDGTSGTPSWNRDCNVALEQQEPDIVFYQEGLTGSNDNFDPNTSPQNRDGTYKYLIYNQIKNTFYNKYNNPLTIFGEEYIDFPLGKTLRNLSDQFKLFSVPQKFFGEKIAPQSVKFFDTTLDDNVDISDDGYQNLVASQNLFSKIQEVRSFGNDIYEGTSSNACPVYLDEVPANITESASVTVGFNYGELLNLPPYLDSGSVVTSFYSGSLTDIITVLSCSIVPFTNSIAFYTGSLDSTIYIRNGIETGSITTTFYSGSSDTWIFPVYGTEDTASMTLAFYSGSIHNEVYPANDARDTGSMYVGFLNGALNN